MRRLYGFPGDGINGIMGALERAEDKLRFIQVRHEEMAAFMACAHAKFTGDVGVCLPTSGPGAIHLLNGVYDAKMDHQPVVAIVGQSARAAMGGSYQQEVDLHSLFKDVAHEYVQSDAPRQRGASRRHPVRHRIDRPPRSWRKTIEEDVADWWEVLEARAFTDADPINPQRVFWELSARLPDGAIITADSGTVANWYARDLKVRPGMMASLSGNSPMSSSQSPYWKEWVSLGHRAVGGSSSRVRGVRRSQCAPVAAHHARRGEGAHLGRAQA